LWLKLSVFATTELGVGHHLAPADAVPFGLVDHVPAFLEAAHAIEHHHRPGVGAGLARIGGDGVAEALEGPGGFALDQRGGLAQGLQAEVDALRGIQLLEVLPGERIVRRRPGFGGPFLRRVLGGTAGLGAAGGAFEGGL
jgi:hypothetical protein